MEQKQSRLLIVDDQIANLRILQRTFEAEGYSVHTAETVEQAKRLLLDSESGFDLVLSDIQMPGETGFDLVRWAKMQDFAETPILLITSQLPEPEHRIFGLSLGAVDYVLRSLDPEELVVRVRKAIHSFKQLRRLRANLEDSENLASVGRALAAVNHEVKNLAQIILFSGNLLQKQLADGVIINKTAANQALEALLNSSGLLTDVTKSMHSLLDKSATRCQPLAIGELTMQVVAMMRPVLKVCYIDTSRVGSGYWAMGHATQFKQVLINLLLNAREAIRESIPIAGGEIVLEVRNEDNRVLIGVTDNGVGFPQAETRADFPAFATTKQLRGGKGLGLWLGSRFVRGMGGSFCLTSKGPGKGTSALIRLVPTIAPEGKDLIDVASYLDDDFSSFEGELS